MRYIRNRLKIFFGWWVVIASFISVTIVFGIVAFAFGVFFNSLIKEFGWSRTAVSTAFSVFALTSGIVGPLVGRLIDRIGPRKVMIPGALGLGLCFLFLSLMSSLWHFYIIFFSIGLCYSATSIVPTHTVIVHWFKKKRGRALGIVNSGIGFAGLAFAPLSGYLILHYGWRSAYLGLGLIALCTLIPAISFWIRHKPEDLGLLPDGEKGTDQQLNSLKEKTEYRLISSMSGTMAMKTMRFWMLLVVYFLYTIVFASIAIHLVPHAVDLGFSLQIGAYVLGLATAISIFGKIGFGLLSEKFNTRYLIMISFLGLIASIVSLIKAQSLGQLCFFAVLFGLFYGGGTTLTPILVVENFGLVSYGEILGYTMIGLTLGQALGPIITGYIFDCTHNYYWAFVMFIGALCLATIAAYFARIPKLKEQSK